MVCKNIAGPNLKLRNVHFHLGNQILLKDISVEFTRGLWYGIAGPNGGGKSTLIKTILGLNNHQGSITLDWPSSPELEGAGNIGYIPQLLPFDESLPISVRDYLLMSLSTKPVWFKRGLPIEVENALEHIQLKDKLERRIGDLSGGERQRLMLATALLQNPGLLILDEPMTGLDEQGKKDSLELLNRFKVAGGTILMIEHDWGLIREHCNQTFWVDKTIREVDPSQIQITQAPSGDVGAVS
ncbi:MAG: metal ABC transporter ATP-binding protein [Oleiphilaceae bacterium]|nr:metal ABC transporter ATP-binding protein [Oleiphilaceae bacterium]